MAVFPEFPIVEIKEESQIPNRTYKLDLDAGRIVGYVDDDDAIQQAAAKILYTPRFDCYAYDDQYGSEIKSLLGNKDVTREYIEAELEFLIQDALCADGRFQGISDLTMRFDGDAAYFTFNAETTEGDTELEYEEGVSINV